MQAHHPATQAYLEGFLNCRLVLENDHKLMRPQYGADLCLDKQLQHACICTSQVGHYCVCTHVCGRG